MFAIKTIENDTYGIKITLDSNQWVTMNEWNCVTSNLVCKLCPTLLSLKTDYREGLSLSNLEKKYLKKKIRLTL